MGYSKSVLSRKLRSSSDKITLHLQEFYTSSESNIVDAQGKDAIVSLIGTLGYGLTWGGGIFINPIIVRVRNLKIITLTGAFVMSLGLILASFSTKVFIDIMTSLIEQLPVFQCDYVGLASPPHASYSIWTRRNYALFPHYVECSAIL